jgi:hypothetical protein
MADQTSSLPVKTLNNGDVAAKIVDGTTPSQALAVDSTGRIIVKLDDAAGNGLTSQVNGAQQALDVGINVAGVQIDPRSIRALTSADVVTANQGTANTITNAWPIKLTDGTNTTSITAAGEVKVDITQPLPAGTNNIGSITNITGTVSLPTGAATSANQTTIITDLAPLNYAQGSTTSGELGNLILTATTTSAPTYTTATSNPLSTDTSGSLRVVVAESLPAGANTIGAVTQASGPWTQNITQVLGAAPSATNALATQIATAGAYVSPTNPLPVALSAIPAGTLVNKYNTTSALAAGATANHVYTITATKTFTGKKFWASSIGAIRADVQTSPDGTTYTTFWTGFNSTATPNITIDLDTIAIQDSGTGSTIRIQITNTEPVFAENVYSTISGTEA